MNKKINLQKRKHEQEKKMIIVKKIIHATKCEVKKETN
jgi:hypothetical protein